MIFKNFYLFKTKIDLYCLKNFEKIKDKFRKKLRKYGYFRDFERF